MKTKVHVKDNQASHNPSVQEDSSESVESLVLVEGLTTADIVVDPAQSEEQKLADLGKLTKNSRHFTELPVLKFAWLNQGIELFVLGQAAALALPLLALVIVYGMTLMHNRPTSDIYVPMSAIATVTTAFYMFVLKQKENQGD